MTDYVPFVMTGASVAIYIIIRNKEYKYNVQLGMLIYAYIRDINKLLVSRLSKNWKDLSMPDKLDRLKAIYDLIDSFDRITVKSIEDPDLLEEIEKL